MPANKLANITSPIREQAIPMQIKITLEEARAVRSVFAVAYVVDTRTELIMLPDEAQTPRWMERTTEKEGTVESLAFSPEGAFFNDVRRAVVLAFTEQAYDAACTYSIENLYSMCGYRDSEDPREGVTLSGIPLKTGWTVLLDYDIAEDNSEQPAGPTYSGLTETLTLLGLPEARYACV